MVPKRSRCCGPTDVITAWRGRTSAQMEAISPGAYASISTTKVRWRSSRSSLMVLDTPMSVLKLFGVARVGPYCSSMCARMCLVEVLP